MRERYKGKEPVWAKYITEDNLPTEDLGRLCRIIGLEATKKLMFDAPGDKFSIYAHCNQKYKKQYIIDNYLTVGSYNKLAVDCNTTKRYVYKAIKEHIEGKKDK